MVDDACAYQWIFSEAELSRTPSVEEGLQLSVERSYRHQACLLVMALGKQLKVNHLVLSAASIMIQRFYALQSFLKHERHIVAVTCLFLAGKVEESPRRLQDIVELYYYNAGRPKGDLQTLQVQSDMRTLKDKILVAERIVLQTLSFDLQFDHPYGYAMGLLKALKTSYPSDTVRQEVRQKAVNFLSDSFGTVLCLQHRPNAVATAAVFLATLDEGVPPPSRGLRNSTDALRQQSWFEIFLENSNISEENFKKICFQMISVYENIAEDPKQSKFNADLEKYNEQKAAMEEEKKRSVESVVRPVAPPSGSALGAVPRPPPPFPRPAAGPPPPPPPPARPPPTSASGIKPQTGHFIAPTRPLLSVVSTAPKSGMVPPTPESLPPPSPASSSLMSAPPTPGSLPPPTPDRLAPPTPEAFPPPTPEQLIAPSSQVDGTESFQQDLHRPRMNSLTESGDSYELAKKRRAEDRTFNGTNVLGSGSNFGRENLVDQSNESPPKKHKFD